jgi:aminodeoxyfutalosine synthase
MTANRVQSALRSIRTKIEAGQRLSREDGEFLFRPEVDLHAVGQLADLVRRRKNGSVAYYNINAHLNPTNVCIYRCPLCAYSRDPDDPTAYVMDRDEILARGQEAAESGSTELHIVGGIHPAKDYSWYRGILAGLHEAYPTLHLKAWTPVEIAWFAESTGRSVREILEDLMSVGLGSLPGGGAEIFDPEIRRRIAPRKADAQTWLAVHRTAHGFGLRTNATMLYGHLETVQHRVDHLLRLRGLQDETGGFQAFIPLAFHPEGTQLAHLVPRPPTALDDLRTVAVSRLLLDNFDHIKAYWISLGVPTAQIALCYGADDLDGTVRHEKIHHDAGSKAPEILSVDELEALIREAGFEPVERDTLYRRVRRKGAEWEVEE